MYHTRHSNIPTHNMHQTHYNLITIIRIIIKDSQSSHTHCPRCICFKFITSCKPHLCHKHHIHYKCFTLITQASGKHCLSILSHVPHTQKKQLTYTISFTRHTSITLPPHSSEWHHTHMPGIKNGNNNKEIK